MMSIHVQLFAKARELAGSPGVTLELPDGSSIAMLRYRLTQAVPALAAILETSAIAVNHDIADASHVLSEQDEVAVIPPVSGG